MDSELFSVLEEMARLKREMEASAKAQTTGRDIRLEEFQRDINERLDREFERIEARFAAITDARAGDTLACASLPDLKILDPLFGKGVFDAGPNPRRHRRHLIMPIHPPKIVHLSSVFGQLRDARLPDVSPATDVLWTLVTTSATERETLEAYVSTLKPFIPIDLEIVSAIELCELINFGYLAEDLARNTNGGIINVKKLLAIYRAFDRGAEEICCIDSDVMFLKHPATMFDQMRDNYAKRVFFSAGAPNENIRDIVKASAEYMLSGDTAIILSTMGESRFSWFFDVPYYPVEHGHRFFAYIQYRHGGLERALRKLSWHSFDHILFVNFLVRHAGFRMVDVTPLIGRDSISDELLLGQISKVTDAHEYKPAWAPLYSILEGEKNGQKQDFCIAFHVDRIKPTI